MDLGLKNKVALITGSTRGIGLGIAKHMLRSGAKVIINGRHQEATWKVSKELSDLYPERVMGIAADVSVAADVTRMVADILKVHAAIDILVNNAGVTKDNLLLRMTEEQWNTVFSVNLKSLFLVSKAVLRSMLRSGSGRIINLSSVVGQMGNAGQVNYAASKGGVIAFTKSLAKEVASKGITVNAITPGFIETDMTDALDEKAKEALTQYIPLKRLGTPQDIASAVCYLASDGASYVTGHILSVNGGLFMGG